MKSAKWIAIGAAAMLAVACGNTTTTTTNTGGGGNTQTDTTGGTDGGGGGGTTADNTKNKADLKVTDDKSASVDIKAEKPADKGDATSKAWGASNSDKVLNLFITEAKSDGNSIVITAFVNTEKYPLPATGIPLGEPNSDAWVTYVAAGPALTGSFSSKDKGTLDISVCPQDGKALVGTLKGATLYNDTPVGPATQTLDGTFNLVYWVGSGTLKCEEKPVTGDKPKVDKFTPPAGTTCDANPCDGGDNATRNCCPYGTCISDCAVKCAEAVNTCMQGCLTSMPPDATCITGCTDKLLTCNDACPASCGASASCQTSMKAVNKCWMDNAQKCGELDDEDAEDKCYFEACCAQIKAAF